MKYEIGVRRVQLFSQRSRLPSRIPTRRWKPKPARSSTTDSICSAPDSPTKERPLYRNAEILEDALIHHDVFLAFSQDNSISPKEHFRCIQAEDVGAVRIIGNVGKSVEYRSGRGRYRYPMG